MEYPKECILPAPSVFDSHAHLDDKQFDGIRDTLIPKMRKNGVMGIITCGCDVSSSKAALRLSAEYDFIYAAVGIHPEELGDREKTDEILKLAGHEKCVAIGEIGLDYYWEKEKRYEQIDLFEKQILMAKDLDLPIIVHDRDAHEDTLNLLKKHRPRGVVHCFSGSAEMAKEVLKLGMYIGIGGVITFKNARKLPEVLAVIPNDRLLIETDCPYLAPEPYRGKLNHSGLIPFTAQKMAELRGSTTEDILTLTAKNTKTLFKLK